MTEEWWFDFQNGQEVFLQSFQTGFGFHPATYSTSTEEISA